MFRAIIALICLGFYGSAFSANYKVLSWNTFLLPDYLKRTYHNERLPKLIEKLESSDYDFIMLQETFTRSSYKKLNRALQAKGYFTSGKPFRRFYKPFNSGLVIFSKYPLSDVKIMLFDHLAAEDKFSSKGVLFSKATLPTGDKVQLATTHFQAKQGKKYQAIRESHIDQIVDVFRRVFNEKSIPVIFGGDFNIGESYGAEHSSFMRRFKELGLVTTKPASRQVYTSDCVGNSLKKHLKPTCSSRKQVDYIFYRAKGNSSNKELKPSLMSDLIILDFKDRYKTKDGILPLSLSDHMSVEALIDL